MSQTIKNTDYDDNMQLFDEGFEVYYLGGDDENRVIASALVDIPDFDADGGQRMLNLYNASGSEFDFFETTQQHVIWHRGENEGREMSAYITDRQKLAIGIHLMHLEIHGVAEDEAWKHVENELPSHWLDEYVAYVDDLSKKERGELMMNQLKRKMRRLREYSSVNPFWKKAIADGEWREKGLSEEYLNAIKSAVDSVELDPRSCHYTAQGVFNELSGQGNVEYCEGFAYSKWLGRPLRHAWLEVDEKVVEVTWPWHRFDGSDGLYYGVPIEKDTVKERIDSRARGTKALLDDAELARLSQIERYQRSE